MTFNKNTPRGWNGKGGDDGRRRMGVVASWDDARIQRLVALTHELQAAGLTRDAAARRAFETVAAEGQAA
jgi:hypothetical protein